MYEEILLPTDGGESMDPVVEHAVEIARGRAATVHVLYVVDDRAFLTLADDLQDDVTAELTAEGEAAVAAADERLRGAGVETVRVTRRGDPAEEILDYAAAAGVDLVTMGTHGANYRQNMVGSVSARVVAESPVPVLTVRVGDEA